MRMSSLVRSAPLALVSFLAFLRLQIVLAATVTQSDLLVSGGSSSANASTGVNFKDNFLRTAEDFMLGLLVLVAVSVFIYIGYTLVTAQGDEKKFKDAWKSLAYAVIGLAIVPLSYVVIKIVTGFSL